jgi:hypothetical protein
LGVRLDRELAGDELAGVVEDAYACVAPPMLVEQAVGAAILGQDTSDDR